MRMIRHSEQTAWDNEILKQAAELYATGMSQADVADQFGVDAQTRRQPTPTSRRHRATPTRLDIVCSLRTTATLSVVGRGRRVVFDPS